MKYTADQLALLISLSLREENGPGSDLDHVGRLTEGFVELSGNLDVRHLAAEIIRWAEEK